MRIVIADDDMLVSGALRTILEKDQDIEVQGIASNGKEAIELYRKYEQRIIIGRACAMNPDLLLMDIRMSPMSGLEAAEEILKEKPEAKILLLTTFSDDEYIVKALKCGVKGYLLKQDYASILPAIRAVCTGQTVFGTQIISRLPELLERKSAFDYATYEITEKERAVMKLVADGKSNKEIAGEMFLSEGTIRNYISGILDKLNLRDRTQLAVFYLRNCT